MIDEGRLHSTSAPGAVTVALGQPIELSSYRAGIEAGERPRHVLVDLADQTGGVVVTAEGARRRLSNLIGGLLVGEWTHWWVARRALAASNGGYIHANGETIGFALLLLQWLRPSRSVRVGFWVMTPTGRRVGPWLRLIRLLRLRPLLVAESEAKAEAVRRAAGPSARVVVLPSPMDLAFWSPAHPEASTGQGRPLVASSGLEKRDYVTLATAVAPLDVEVVVCAVSPDARSGSATVPARLPANMRFADLSIRELRDLFRRAHVVVVPTRPNRIDAGGSSSLEAMACGAPMVASAQGIYLTYAEAGLIEVVPVGDGAELSATISRLLSDDPRRMTLGRAARAHLVAEHDEQAWRAAIIEHVRRGGVTVGEPASPAPAVRAAAPLTPLQP